MAQLEVLFGIAKRTRIGVVNLDASVSETHTKRNEIPNHPVEEGSDIADHVRRVPEEIVINGLVSNYPIAILASLTAASPIEGDSSPIGDRTGEAYKRLREIMDTAELIDVVTSLWDYTNMIISDMRVEREAATGNVINATITCKEVVLAQIETVEAPENLASPAPDLGSKPTTPASPEQDISLLGSISRGAGRVAGVN